MAQSITPRLVLRRFFLWLLICSVSAAPSFLIGASDGANRAGMAAGVLVFVLAYTWLTCTERFQRFYERRYIRPTMQFGYGARLFLSALAALTLVEPDRAIFAVLPDVYCGLLSVVAGSVVVGLKPLEAIETFHGAMVITCLQGALLNVIVFILMLLFYPLRRSFGGPPPELRRGFEVMTPTATPVEPTHPSNQ
jgi:hypothetical protein